MLVLNAAIEMFLSHCQYEMRLNLKTIKAYGTDLRQFYEFLEGNSKGLMVHDVTKEALQEYLRHLSSVYKPRSMRRKVASLKAFLNHLEFEDHIEVNPFRKMRLRIKQGRCLPRIIHMRDLRRLFRYLYKVKNQCMPVSTRKPVLPMSQTRGWKILLEFRFRT